jgi:hypothetical protein
MIFSLAPMCHHMNDQLVVNLTISIGLLVKITIEKSNVITCVILSFMVSYNVLLFYCLSIDQFVNMTKMTTNQVEEQSATTMCHLASSE